MANRAEYYVAVLAVMRGGTDHGSGGRLRDRLVSFIHFVQDSDLRGAGRRTGG